MRTRTACVLGLLLLLAGRPVCAAPDLTYYSDLVDAVDDCRQALRLYPREETGASGLLERVVKQNEHLRDAHGRIEPHAGGEASAPETRTSARSFLRALELLLDSNQLVFAAYETGQPEEADRLLQQAVALRSQGWQQAETAVESAVRLLETGGEPPAAGEAGRVAGKIRSAFGDEIARPEPPPLYRSLRQLHDRLTAVSEPPAAG